MYSPRRPHQISQRLLPLARSEAKQGMAYQACYTQLATARWLFFVRPNWLRRKTSPRDLFTASPMKYQTTIHALGGNCPGLGDPLALIARHAITFIPRCIQQAGNDSRCTLVSRTVVQYRTVLLGKVLRIQHFRPSKPKLDDRAFFEPRVELEDTWLGCSFGSVPRGQ
ncbi:hypothetical protein L209DRAFT_591931 [Thermothelomyces heterothallicus CBS 203.75]